MTERYILQAIQEGVKAAVAASSKPTLGVKYVGRTFTPPGDTGWLEVVHIPNDIQNEFWASGKTYQGVFRLILHWPIDDEGAYDKMDLIRSIGSYFTKGSRLIDPGSNVNVKITDHPNFMGVMEEPPELLIPISIRYQYYKA